MKGYAQLALLCGVALLGTAKLSGAQAFMGMEGYFNAGRRVEQLQRDVSVHAARRGNPWINLLDGYDLPMTPDQAAGSGWRVADASTNALSLAAADFDEDGVPDLVCGYRSLGEGLISLHRGNVDSIDANSPEARERKAAGTFTDALFFPDVPMHEVPEAPDFLAVGKPRLVLNSDSTGQRRRRSEESFRYGSKQLDGHWHTTLEKTSDQRGYNHRRGLPSSSFASASASAFSLRFWREELAVL